MKSNFSVSGMMCAACASHVEGAVKRIAGVQDVTVSLLTNSMTVIHTCPASDIENAVSHIGYEAALLERKASESSFTHIGTQAKSERTATVRMLLSATLSLVLFVICMGHMLGMPLPHIMSPTHHPINYLLIQAALATPVLFLQFGYFRRGTAALLRLRPSMDTLVALGSGAAYLHGMIVLVLALLSQLDAHDVHVYFEASAMILALVSIGKRLEGKAKDKTADAIRALAALSPKTATVLSEDGIEMTVNTESLTVGMHIVLRAGDSIPADGKVVAGHGAIDESSLTGESLPIDKKEGDTVTSGSMMKDGYLVFCAERVGDETSLSETVRMVADAAATKAPIAKAADAVAAVFVPVVLLIALISFLAFFIVTESLSTALSHLISVLVISCPCALGLATPTAIMTATGRGAELGILFKSAESLEALGHINTVAFDKTGTLTNGKMTLADYRLTDGTEPSEAARVLYALESQSSHPIGEALAAHFAAYAGAETKGFSVIEGKGVFARVDGQKCMAGNLHLFEEDLEFDISPLRADFDRMTAAGATAVFLSAGERLLGIFSVADTLRDESPDAISALHRLGIQTCMLTGDNTGSAAYMAEKAGIAEFHASLSPKDKAQLIEALAKGGKTAMVGDGINDALPLVSADVGIAVGAGTDVAIASADVVLRRETPLDVVNAITLGRATLRNIRQNLFWALAYNSLCIPIAAGVFAPLGLTLSPMLAAAAMSLSSLFVVGNALRLRRFKPILR